MNNAAADAQQKQIDDRLDAIELALVDQLAFVEPHLSDDDVNRLRVTIAVALHGEARCLILDLLGLDHAAQAIIATRVRLAAQALAAEHAE